MQTQEPLESIIGPRERTSGGSGRDVAEKAPDRDVAAEPAIKAKAESHQHDGREPVVRDAMPDAATRVARSADDDADEDGDIEPGESGLKKALKAERKLRREARKQAQELQRQIDYIQGQMAARQAAVPRAEQPKAKEDDGSKEFDDFLAQGPAYVRRVAETQAREHYAKVVRRDITREQRALERQHEDAAPAIGKFFEHARQDPRLAARFTAIADGDDAEFESPVEFAYQWGRAYQQASEVGDLATYKERLRAELLAEIQAKGTEHAEAEPVQAPKTLAGARGSGGAGTGARISGPVPIGDLIGPSRAARR